MNQEQLFFITIQSILQKPFEDRNQIQNDILETFFTKLLPTYSRQQCTWLSLFCNYYPNLTNSQLTLHLQIQPQSLAIYPLTHSHSFQVMTIKNEEDLAQIPKQNFAIIISKRNIQNSRALSQQSIQNTVKLLRSFEYLSQIPRKRFYHIIKNLDLLQFSFNQAIYLQNELIQHEYYVYLVKKGEFTFLKREKSTHKNVQLYTFSQGYIFGTQEEFQYQNKYRQVQRSIKERRNFTVKCQSSQSQVYRIKIDFFNSFMRKFCEHLLKINNLKLNRFIQQRLINAQMNFTRNAQFITQPLRRTLSIPTINKRNLIGFPKDKDTNQILINQEKKQTLPLLHFKSQFSMKRKKLFSKQQLKGMSPEYQQQKMILMKKIKCDALRQSTKPLINPTCKGQILLNLMKTSYQFEKTKGKKSFN